MNKKSNRRNILKKVGATAIGASVLTQGSSAAGSEPEPLIIKGNSKNPVQRSQVKRVQGQIRKRLSRLDNSPAEIALRNDPVPSDGELVGYGLAVEDGAPVEVTKTVGKPTPLSEVPLASTQATTHGPETLGSSNAVDAQQRREMAKQKMKKHAGGISKEDHVNIAHSELDKFRHKHSGGR